MNQKAILLVVGILAGVAVAVFVPKLMKSGDKPTQSEQTDVTANNTAPVVETTPTPAPAPKPVVETKVRPATKTAPAPVSAWARLAEKYGTEKTALSSKITSNLTSVINQGLELANTMATNSGSSSISEAASKGLLRNATTQLSLTEDQQQKAGAIIESAVNKRMSAVTDLTAAMGSEPEQIMELLLAGDALKQNQITQEEYDRITQNTRTMLQNMGGFVGGRPGASMAQIFGDEETAAQFNSILTPEQQTKLTEITKKLAEQVQARQNSGSPFQPGQIPVMELDKLDQSVASIQQMAQAAKMMMEAAKGLKDAGATPR
jgi:Spy/CpxP family protein refolding chaperone